MAWTTAQDVLGSWIGEDAPTDSAKIDTWIGKAERLVRREVPDIQTRIDAEAPETELLETARDVVVEMVTELFRNPEGRRSSQVTTGPFTENVTFGGDSPGKLFITADQLSRLRGTQTGQQAFGISMIPSTSPFSPLYGGS